MQPQRVKSQLKNALVPRIDRERCIGCGVCTGACKKKALRMGRSSERPFVPANTMERSIRMTLERGRLAHLIVDEGTSRGHRFLNRVIKVLTDLPPADKILASEQVRSRFIRKALGVVPDPTGD